MVCDLRPAMSPHGHRIVALLAIGYSGRRLARELGTTRRTLQRLQTDASSVPRHDLGLALAELHATRLGLPKPLWVDDRPWSRRVERILADGWNVRTLARAAKLGEKTVRDLRDCRSSPNFDTGERFMALYRRLYPREVL